jgi:glutamate synthase (NADPH/NADH) large chain
VEALQTRAAIEHWKAVGLDLEAVLAAPPEGAAISHSTSQDHGLDAALDLELIRQAKPALEQGKPVSIEAAVRNVNRTVGTMLGYEVTRRYQGAGLPDGTIDVTLTGTGGQSFGAFVPQGITLRLFGDANDYAGKGLSGGRIIIRPHRTAMLDDSQDVIAGNVIAYGATSGELFLRGQVGERFCVRNSGATAVVEGVGDHALEYMTGGTAVILGNTGRNLGAGMSGGTAYVLDLRSARVNPDALASGEITLGPLDSEDEIIVRDLLEQHLAHTESPRARELLNDWPAAAERFTRVLPAQYARVREALAEIEISGGDLTAPGAWAEFLEVTGG